MRISIEYGSGVAEVEVPDDTAVIGQHSYTEPPSVDPVAAVDAALRTPAGMPPIRELVGPHSRVAIAFPDRVKGGSHDKAHRRVATRAVLRELAASGVSDTNVSLICAVGLHRKNSTEQIADYMPGEVLDNHAGRVTNHDAEDPDGIVDLGLSDMGDPVAFNRACAEADLTVVLGHVQGNPYGGFSGGVKTFTTGLTTWRSIAGHHVPSTMHRSDFVPISTRSHFRAQLSSIASRIESGINGRLFLVDAVIGRGAEVLGVFAGGVNEVQQASWPLAEQRTNIPIAGGPFDVVVFGVPADFHYGPGMGRNPILVGQAIAASLTRVAAVLQPGAVAVVAAQCDGYFNDEWFPSYRETFNRWSGYKSVSEMGAVIEELCGRSDYIQAYRSGKGYHPFHAFSMLSMAEIGLRLTSRIFVAGAKLPGHVRAMGMQPVRSIEEGLRQSEKYVGTRPRVLALPGFLTSIPPHLFMV